MIWRIVPRARVHLLRFSVVVAFLTTEKGEWGNKESRKSRRTVCFSSLFSSSAFNEILRSENADVKEGEYARKLEKKVR